MYLSRLICMSVNFAAVCNIKKHIHNYDRTISLMIFLNHCISHNEFGHSQTEDNSQRCLLTFVTDLYFLLLPWTIFLMYIYIWKTNNHKVSLHSIFFYSKQYVFKFAFLCSNPPIEAVGVNLVVMKPIEALGINLVIMKPIEVLGVNLVSLNRKENTYKILFFLLNQKC